MIVVSGDGLLAHGVGPESLGWARQERMQLRLLQIPAVLSDRAYDRNFLAFELRLALLMSRRLTHEGYHEILASCYTLGVALIVDS